MMNMTMNDMMMNHTAANSTNTFCTPMGHGIHHGSGNDSAGMIMYMDGKQEIAMIKEVRGSEPAVAYAIVSLTHPPSCFLSLARPSIGFRFSLHESSPCLNLYFPGWTLDTRGKFAGAMIGIVLLAVLTEGLSMIRFKLQNSFKSQPQRRRWVLTGVHGLQALTGYILMLATMTFSIELLLCVILGLGLGYGLFYNEGDTHVTTNPCCNFIQSEANERETQLHTDDHCEHQDENDKTKDDAAPESAVERVPTENV